MRGDVEHNLRLLRALLRYRLIGRRRTWRSAIIVARIRWLSWRLRRT